MIQESTEEQKHSPNRNPLDLTVYEQAQKLVDELFEGEGSDPFLKIMGYLRLIFRHGSRLDLDTATMNLTVAAFSHSNNYLEVIENYASSLLSDSRAGEGQTLPKHTVSTSRPSSVDSIISIITDETLPEEFRNSVAHEATEMMNRMNEGEEALIAWLRLYFDESRERIAKVPAPKDSCLSESVRQSDLIKEWASSNRTPSRKLDLMAALVDADDDLIIEALLVALQGKGGRA